MKYLLHIFHAFLGTRNGLKYWESGILRLLLGTIGTTFLLLVAETENFVFETHVLEKLYMHL